jgi:DNA-binding FrmR family transcriptional regulator
MAENNKTLNPTGVDTDVHAHTHEHVHEHVHTHDGEEHSHVHTHVHSHEHDHTGSPEHEHEHEGHEHEAHDHSHHEHSHGHGKHSHTHSPEEIKSIVNRLSRAIGHLESVKNMVINGRDCSEVLVQLSAVRSALNNTGLLILQEHINHCIVEAVQENDQESIAELNKAIMKYFR